MWREPGSQPVEDVLALPPRDDELVAAKHGELLRQRGLPDIQALRELAHAELFMRHGSQQLQSVDVAKNAQQVRCAIQRVA